MDSKQMCASVLQGFIFAVMIAETIVLADHSEREKRNLPLIFPPTNPTRTQWIIGFGIPLENLMYEAMTTGYVLKAEYWLPITVDDLRIRRPMKFQARHSMNNTNFELFSSLKDKLTINNTAQSFVSSKLPSFSNYRWSVYKALEQLSTRLGFDGRTCVLKSICEAANIPFHYYNGIYAELLHILLTPSSSADSLSEHSDNEYFYAEKLGHSGGNCHKVFKECRMSLLEIFSEIHETSV